MAVSWEGSEARRWDSLVASLRFWVEEDLARAWRALKRARRDCWVEVCDGGSADGVGFDGSVVVGVACRLEEGSGEVSSSRSEAGDFLLVVGGILMVGGGGGLCGCLLLLLLLLFGDDG